MSMELKGKIVQALSEVTGQGKKGEWRKKEYVIETVGQYPKKVCFSVWNDNIDSFRIKEGSTVNVSLDAESREYNGRWYTELKAWKLNGSEGSSSDDNGGLPF